MIGTFQRSLIVSASKKSPISQTFSEGKPTFHRWHFVPDSVPAFYGSTKYLLIQCWSENVKISLLKYGKQEMSIFIWRICLLIFL